MGTRQCDGEAIMHLQAVQRKNLHIEKCITETLDGDCICIARRYRI